MVDVLGHLPHFPRHTQTDVPPELFAQPEPAIFVIFGITGNLASTKLLPALYHLFKDNLLNEHTTIVGLSRQAIDVDKLLAQIELCVLEADKVCDPPTLRTFRARLQLVKFDAAVASDYRQLHHTLQAIEDAQGVCMNRLFYLAIPPQLYRPVIQHLADARLNAGCKHTRAVSRLLIEKPFGYDLASARELVAQIDQCFSEAQVFRIDHFLAKETAQNILTFRRSNPLFAEHWDNRHIAGLELTLSEQIGVEGRTAFYDNVGALRDVVQNHLLQLLALVTMELPKNLDSSSLHTYKQRLLEQVASVDPRRQTVIRGQYDGYQTEVSNPGSSTETYVSLPLSIRSPRWRGVPISLTAGKALKTRATRIVLTYADKARRHSNQLTFRIQPNEGIDVGLSAKRPGFANETEAVDMDFSYRSAFGNSKHPDAYERVLVDALKGDHSLFATNREVLESWRILQPVLDYWQQGSDDLKPYRRGSQGPADTQDN